MSSENRETIAAPLLDDHATKPLSLRVWIETKMLWRVVGPAIFSRITSYSMFVITQAFAGHLGDLELAAMAIASNVVVGFDFGLLLGMASALETLCGQAFGAKNYGMLGIYLQRSWIVLLLCCVALLPIFFFATPILKLLGQPDDVAELSGVVAVCFIPLHFSFAMVFPLQRFLQSQLKNYVTACANLAAFVAHVLLNWLVVYRLQMGLVGTTLILNISWWLVAAVMYLYVVCGGCPNTWTGFSAQAFSGLWDIVKLSASSGVMLCLETWYYKILIVMTGNLENAKIAVDALSVCMNINGWEMMIPLGFFAGTGVRVANELGAGNAKGAKFATNSFGGGRWIWMAVIRGIHQPWLLLFGGGPTWSFNGMGFPSRSSGNMGWYGFWWNFCSNIDTCNYYNKMRLGKRGGEGNHACPKMDRFKKQCMN